MTTRINTVQISVSQRVSAGLVCIFVGATLVFTVGMAQMSSAHNAAHDTRHALAFPCH